MRDRESAAWLVRWTAWCWPCWKVGEEVRTPPRPPELELPDPPWDPVRRDWDHPLVLETYPDLPQSPSAVDARNLHLASADARAYHQIRAAFPAFTPPHMPR